jgi:DNA-binding LacI/PurR family transcriptional regulator
LNGTARVTPETEERVRIAAAQLGVDWNRRKETRLIAFILGNRPLLHPFHSRILAGAESYCAARDYNVVFMSLRYETSTAWAQLPCPRLLKERDLVDGYVLAGVNSQNLLDFLSQTGLPLAVLGNSMLDPWDGDKFDAAYFDDIDGSYRTVRYLQSLGHRHICFIGNRLLPWFARCYEGYARAMTEAGLQPRSAGLDSDQQTEVGYLATKGILAGGEPLTAILTGGDPTAQGVYDALREHGVKIPGDISVAGFDDIEAPSMDPPLTTVHVFLERVGERLAEFVLNRIAHPDLPRQHFVVPTKLTKRESCSPVVLSQQPDDIYAQASHEAAAPVQQR